MGKLRIIANPTAGQGNADKEIPRVHGMLKQLGVEFEIVRTEHPGHALVLAEKAAEEGCGIVAAMGGDGTSNEVLNGLMRARERGVGSSAMGVLCAGRGNDFAYGAGIPMDLEAGCRILAEGKRRLIDAGRVRVDGSAEARHFGNGIGIGFDAVVGFEAARMKHLHGFVSYLVAALKTLFIYFKAPTVRIAYGGEDTVQPSLMVSVMNGRRMGGGFMMAPEAEPDDGLLDLCIVGMPGRLRILLLMMDFMKGSQAGKDPIRMDRTDRLEVTAVEGSLPAHADGETLCTAGRSLTVEILPSAIEIVAG